jgi:NTE family protein
MGKLALGAKTGTQDEWLGWFRQTLAPEWPDRDLRVTTVDAESGEFRAWSRSDGVPVQEAVASSCAVPGIFPCVDINGRRYQDGGVRSGTSADLASGYDSVVIIAPIGAGETGIDPLLGRTTRAEAEALRAAGSRVALTFPDKATLDVFGINRMDTSRRSAAVETGIAQGRAFAAQIEAARITAPA